MKPNNKNADFFRLVLTDKGRDLVKEIKSNQRKLLIQSQRLNDLTQSTHQSQSNYQLNPIKRPAIMINSPLRPNQHEDVHNSQDLLESISAQIKLDVSAKKKNLFQSSRNLQFQQNIAGPKQQQPTQTQQFLRRKSSISFERLDETQHNQQKINASASLDNKSEILKKLHIAQEPSSQYLYFPSVFKDCDNKFIESSLSPYMIQTIAQANKNIGRTINKLKKSPLYQSTEDFELSFIRPSQHYFNMNKSRFKQDESGTKLSRFSKMQKNSDNNMQLQQQYQNVLSQNDTIGSKEYYEVKSYVDQKIKEKVVRKIMVFDNKFDILMKRKKIQKDRDQSMDAYLQGKINQMKESRLNQSDGSKLIDFGRRFKKVLQTDLQEGKDYCISVTDPLMQKYRLKQKNSNFCQEENGKEFSTHKKYEIPSHFERQKERYKTIHKKYLGAWKQQSKILGKSDIQERQQESCRKQVAAKTPKDQQQIFSDRQLPLRVKLQALKEQRKFLQPIGANLQNYLENMLNSRDEHLGQNYIV